MASENPDKLGQITLPIGASVVTFLLVVLLTGAYGFYARDGEKIVLFFAAAVTAASTVLLCFYTAKSVQELLHDRGAREKREDLREKRERIECAMQFGRRWNDPGLYHVREVCRIVIQMKHDGKGAEIPDFIKEKETNVGHILNFLEEIALAKKHGTIDPDIVRDQFEGIVIQVWQSLEPWVNQHRNHRGRPKIWKRLEELYKEWSH